MREPLRGKQQSEALRSNQVRRRRESTISREHNLARAQSRESTISREHNLTLGEQPELAQDLSVQLGDGRLTGTRVAHEDAIEAHLCEVRRAVMSTCMPGVPGSPTKTRLRRSKATQRASEEIRGHRSVAITSSGGSSISSSEVISGNPLKRRQLHLFIRGHQWQSPQAAAAPSLRAPHSIPLA
jgi:hypothetical protein